MTSATHIFRRRCSTVALIVVVAFVLLAVAVLLTACVDQHPDEDTSSTAEDASGLRIVATSPAVAQLCAALEIDLVGVPDSDNVPDVYAEVTTVGTAMSPDMEIVASLNADYVLSPNTLLSDLQPQYAAIGVASVFLDTRSVEGLYDSIVWLGEKFDRQEQAQALLEEYEAYMAEFKAQFEDEESPTVLILMGVPGSYIVATENSYVGSLIELAGGENVYAGTDDEFLSANTEDMLTKDPDIILLAAHGMPDVVEEMFTEEFSQNDIWSHFRAVQEGHVYSLPYDQFGMSATLNYTEALEYLLELLYEQ